MTTRTSGRVVGWSTPPRAGVVLAALAVLVLPARGSLAGECTTDADCVPASCCHASACVPRAERPSCTGVVCSEECAPNTLDCGGKCVCKGGECQAEVNALGSDELGDAAPAGKPLPRGAGPGSG